MFLNDFAGADLGGFVEGDGFFKPWSFDHPLSSVFDVSGSIFDQETNAVDQFDLNFLVFAECYGNRFFWDKFGFYGGDEFPGTA